MLRIALSKGRLSEQAIMRFGKINMSKPIDLESRKLVFKDPLNELEYVLLKPTDVVTYVENGVCDLGVVGSDVIMEEDKLVYELADLDFGKCKFAIAGPSGIDVMTKNNLKVATKYPNVARRYFEDMNKSIEIIRLNGSVELAPLLGLADCIVDIVETGSTLKANNLQVIEDMYQVSARLICNSISYRFNQDKFKTWVKLLEAK